MGGGEGKVRGRKERGSGRCGRGEKVGGGRKKSYDNRKRSEEFL